MARARLASDAPLTVSEAPEAGPEGHESSSSPLTRCGPTLTGHAAEVAGLLARARERTGPEPAKIIPTGPSTDDQHPNFPIDHLDEQLINEATERTHREIEQRTAPGSFLDNLTAALAHAERQAEAGRRQHLSHTVRAAVLRHALADHHSVQQDDQSPSTSNRDDQS